MLQEIAANRGDVTDAEPGMTERQHESAHPVRCVFSIRPDCAHAIAGFEDPRFLLPV